MKQLILTQKQLVAIGFTKKIYPAIKPDDESPFGSSKKTTYEIPCLNGVFRFNAFDKENVWYHDVFVGKHGNSIRLNIYAKPELFVVLSAFNVKFNLDLS